MKPAEWQHWLRFRTICKRVCNDHSWKYNGVIYQLPLEMQALNLTGFATMCWWIRISSRISISSASFKHFTTFHAVYSPLIKGDVMNYLVRISQEWTIYLTTAQSICSCVRWVRDMSNFNICQYPHWLIGDRHWACKYTCCILKTHIYWHRGEQQWLDCHFLLHSGQLQRYWNIQCSVKEVYAACI